MERYGEGTEEDTLGKKAYKSSQLADVNGALLRRYEILTSSTSITLSQTSFATFDSIISPKIPNVESSLIRCRTAPNSYCIAS